MIVWSARLSWRSPDLLRRWRVVKPDEAGIGAAPEKAANAASERNRPGVGPADEDLGSADRADAWQIQQLGSGGGDELADVTLEIVSFGTQCHDAFSGAPQYAQRRAVFDILCRPSTELGGVADLGVAGLAAELRAQRLWC